MWQNRQTLAAKYTNHYFKSQDSFVGKFSDILTYISSGNISVDSNRVSSISIITLRPTY